jgi:hypothetical protein
MGRAGKLDFSIDRVKSTDNQWIPLRYSVTRKSGQSHAVRTGVITAGVAAVFWPAAPVILLMRGKDVVIDKGVAFEVFTDNNHLMGAGGAVSQVASASAQGTVPQQFNSATVPANAALPAAAATAAVSGGSATVTITSNVAGADIEVDGAFVGNTPTSLQLTGGQHRIVVKSGDKSWDRSLQVNAGSTISVNATLK